MSDRPEAMRKRNIAAVRPLSDCAKTNERSGIGTGPLTFSALTSSLIDSALASGPRPSARTARLRNQLSSRLAPLALNSNGGQRLSSNCGPLPRDGGEGLPLSLSPQGRGQGEGRDLVHELGWIDVGDGLHDREGVFRVFHRLPVELAAVRLMILLANRLLADGRVDGQPEESLGDLVGVGASGLLDRLGQEGHADIALDGPRRRVFVLQVLREARGVVLVRAGIVLPVEG